MWVELETSNVYGIAVHSHTSQECFQNSKVERQFLQSQSKKQKRNGNGNRRFDALCLGLKIGEVETSPTAIIQVEKTRSIFGCGYVTVEKNRSTPSRQFESAAELKKSKTKSKTQAVYSMQTHRHTAHGRAGCPTRHERQTGNGLIPVETVESLETKFEPVEDWGPLPEVDADWETLLDGCDEREALHHGKETEAELQAREYLPAVENTERIQRMREAAQRCVFDNAGCHADGNCAVAKPLPSAWKSKRNQNARQLRRVVNLERLRNAARISEISRRAKKRLCLRKMKGEAK